MKASLLVVLGLCLLTTSAFPNQYVTPGTGVKYTLDDLVTNSNGSVTLVSGIYYVSDTIYINTNDTLTIYTDATIKYSANTFLGTKRDGVLLIDPPNNVTFTADDLTTGYFGIRLDSSNASIIRKLTLEYAVSFRISDCNPTLDSCILQYNNHLTSTTFGSGAITLFRASPIIKNSKFIYNKRTAINGGSNGSNAPKIYNSYFFANNTNNVNTPQINLGSSSSTVQDTTKIIGNYIYGGSTNSGGIGFLPSGSLYAIISGNVIRKNRYGIVMQGGSNINAVISYNIIDTNNIENNPNLGGSGISFYGGTATSQQNTIVTGNIIRANLWGITIVPGSRAKPNLGDLSNSDTTDDGKNQFINNTNAATPDIDLYNNTPDNIKAENNYWNTDDPAIAEARIFHQVDNASLGLVDFDPILTSTVLPVTFSRFNAIKKDRAIVLTWQTATEVNTAYFNIQRSADGRSFITIGKVNAANALNYSYIDADELKGNAVFYRLQVIDKDGKTSYSNVKRVTLNTGFNFTISPNPAKNSIVLQGEGIVAMKIISSNGQTVMQQQFTLAASPIDISTLRSGFYIVQITDKNGNFASQQLIVR